jgi:glycosyltransferase involved in cell wall biosynthesis
MTIDPAIASVGSETISNQAPKPVSRMRVVHVIKHCGYANGSVHVAIDLACVQAQAGDDVTVISAGGTFVPLLEQFGVRHLTLPHDQNKPMDVLRTAWAVAKLARRQRPDVIHAHMMSSAFVGWIASRLAGVPLVTTVHNSFDKHSVLMRLGDRVVAVSEAERRSLLERGFPSHKLVAVLNAPDQSPRDVFMDDGRIVKIESPSIVAANALHRRKGVFDLIEACSRLFADMPEWKLYIAGEGPDRQVLEEQVTKLGLGDRMIFLGFLPSPRPLMEQADIFVLASYADPCSLAVGEARAAGCAIVGTAVGGTPEMLEFGKAGRLVEPGNIDQLTATLRELMSDPAARAALRQAALDGASKFSVYRLLGDYAQVYRDAQAQRRGTPAPMAAGNESPA